MHPLILAGTYSVAVHLSWPRFAPALCTPWPWLAPTLYTHHPSRRTKNFDHYLDIIFKVPIVKSCTLSLPTIIIDTVIFTIVIIIIVDNYRYVVRTVIIIKKTTMIFVLLLLLSILLLLLYYHHFHCYCNIIMLPIMNRTHLPLLEMTWPLDCWCQTPLLEWTCCTLLKSNMCIATAWEDLAFRLLMSNSTAWVDCHCLRGLGF